MKCYFKQIALNGCLTELFNKKSIQRVMSTIIKFANSFLKHKLLILMPNPQKILLLLQAHNLHNITQYKILTHGLKEPIAKNHLSENASHRPNIHSLGVFVGFEQQLGRAICERDDARG
jgi:hypothetical protein